MATIKRFRASARGPVRLDVRSTAADVLVNAQDGVMGEIVVRTEDDRGPSADAVNSAEISESGDELRVVVRDNRGQGGMVVGRNSYNVISGGVTIVNGVVISSGGQVLGGSSPIYIAALLPTNSSVRTESTSGDLETKGRLAHVRGRAVSGDMRIDRAASAELQTTSGDIRIDGLRGDARLQSVSGDVRVHAEVSCRVSATTGSGDVSVSGARVDLDGRSVSGRVRQR